MCTLDIDAFGLSKVPGSINDTESLYLGIKTKQNKTLVLAHC